jgi:regulatory protein YycI of two-component signal transduction system YycFG
MIYLIGTLLDRTKAIFLFTFLIIQIFVVYMLFDFNRKPWDGLKIEEEEILRDV